MKIKGAENGVFRTTFNILAEQGVWRERVPVGRVATPKVFRFLRRRPPLEVFAQSQFTVRGDQLSETYSFLCQAFQGELDAVTVHFQNRLEISIGQFCLIIMQRLLLVVSIPLSNVGTESNGTKRSVKESWLVEFNPPVTGAVTLRQLENGNLQNRLLFLWCGSESAVAPKGRISIQSTRASRPSVLNHHLIQLPPLAEQSTLPIHSVVELLYNESALAQTGPSVEILPES